MENFLKLFAEPQIIRMKNYSGVYIILNIITFDFYIGSTDNFNRRWVKEHRYFLRKNIHFNKHLQNAWNKYKEESFIYNPICYVALLEKELLEKELLEIEQYYLDLFKPNYNINLVAGKPPTQCGAGHHMKRPEIKEKFIGENNCGAKLTWKKVAEIREKYFSGKTSSAKLAKEYDISKRNILGIINNKIWKIEYTEEMLIDLSRVKKNNNENLKKHVGETHGMAKLTWNVVNYIREEYLKGRTVTEIAHELKLNRVYLYQIVHNKIWKI